MGKSWTTRLFRSNLKVSPSEQAGINIAQLYASVDAEKIDQMDRSVTCQGIERKSVHQPSIILYGSAASSNRSDSVRSCGVTFWKSRVA